MSAYLVSEQTINRCMSILYDIDFRERPEELGLALWQMNADAVSARYPNDQKLTIAAEDYRPMWSKGMTPAQQLKTLEYFLYQCSEGEIPKRDLYKRVQRRIRRLERDLIEAIPAYRDAEWA